MSYKTCNGYFAPVARVLIDGLETMQPLKFCSKMPKKLEALAARMQRGCVCDGCAVQFSESELTFIVETIATAERFYRQPCPPSSVDFLYDMIDLLLDELAKTDECMAACFDGLLH